MKCGLVPFLAMSFPLAACSGSSTGGTSVPDGGGAGGSGGTDHGGVALSVSSLQSPLKIGNTAPSGGNAFAELDITLQNDSSPTPVSADFALFTLQTDQSLVLDTSGLSGAVTPECSPTTSIASGGSFACKLVFEVPTGQKATTLYYDDTQGHQASAPVPAPAPGSSVCEKYVGMAQQSAGPCWDCVVMAQETGPCSAAYSAGGACDSNHTCDNTCSAVGDPTTRCSCYQGCLTAACWSTFGDAMQCIVSACASSC